MLFGRFVQEQNARQDQQRKRAVVILAAFSSARMKFLGAQQAFGNVPRRSAGGPRPPATYNSRERQRLREVAFELTGNRSTSPIEEGSSSSPNFRLRQLRARCLRAFLAKPFEVGAHERDLSLQAARRVAQHIDRGFGIPQALLRFGVVIVGQYRCDAGQS